MNSRRYLQRTEPRLNIIPMIDVMMFMLVFFVLIVLRSIPDQGMSFNLPHAAKTARLPQHSLVVNVASSGQISLDGTNLTMSQLTSRLNNLKRNGQRHVVIAGASHVSLQTLVSIMSAIRQAGIKNVGVAVRHTSPSS